MTAAEYAAKKMQEKLKKLSKDKLLKNGDPEKQKSDERELNTKYYKAVASGRQSDIDEVNELVAKDYEAKGIEWRDDAEMKTKAQTVGTSGQGGLLVPTTIRTSIIEKLKYISPVRQIATVIPDMPANLTLPSDNALPTTYWVGEGVAITESGATFAGKALTPQKLAGLDSFTSEVLADAAITPGLQTVIEDRFA